MIKNLLLDRRIRRAVQANAEPNIRLVSFEPEDVLGTTKTFAPDGFAHGYVLVSASLWNRMHLSGLWHKVFEAETSKWKVRSGIVGRACGLLFYTEAVWPQSSGLHWMAPNQAVFVFDDQVVVAAVRPLEIGVAANDSHQSSVRSADSSGSVCSDGSASGEAGVE